MLNSSDKIVLDPIQMGVFESNQGLREEGDQKGAPSLKSFTHIQLTNL